MLVALCKFECVCFCFQICVACLPVWFGVCASNAICVVRLPSYFVFCVGAALDLFQHVGSREQSPAERICLRDLVDKLVSLPHWIVPAAASYSFGKRFGIIRFSLLFERMLAGAQGPEMQCNAGHQSVRSRPIPTNRLECRWFVSTVRDRPLLMGLCFYESSVRAIANVERCCVQLIDLAC